jgi:hypothetical protein
MAKLYTQVVGVALLVAGILGFFLKESLGFLHFTATHNLVHIISGLALGYLGFKGNESNQRLGAQIFGVIYGLVTLLGFLNVGNGNPLGLQLHLNTTYNIIHLVIAAWGLYAGFARKSVPATAS